MGYQIDKEIEVRQMKMQVPVLPKTQIKLVKLWPYARRRHQRDEIWTIGYYCRHCGLETIWLMNNAGEYVWTIDREFLRKHFVIIKTSSEKSIYGPKGNRCIKS
jgi:hypothetical protein